MTPLTTSKLALLGGPKSVLADQGDLFSWPIVTEEDEQAVLDVLRRGAMSNHEITVEFEKDVRQWFDVPHALAYCNGTASILGAMFGCGIGKGDEVIVPAHTYWASVLPVLTLRAVPIFADSDPVSLCIDPADIARKITPRTRAILVVHLFGHPCDMDPILDLAAKHDIKVIEDVSHAQGGHYKGKLLGTLGDAGAFSMMAGKSLVAGEGGMLITRDRNIYHRALAYGFYVRFPGEASDVDPELLQYQGLPLGGFKHRINQTCSAMGRVQLKHYSERIAEIQRAMNHFWDLLEGAPGLRAHRTCEPGSDMGGWYNPMGLYEPSELGDLAVEKFVEAVVAEGSQCAPYRYPPLHLHPLLQKADIYNEGWPTAVVHAAHDVRLQPGDLPVTENSHQHLYAIPWFKKMRPELIAGHAAAYRKVAENAEQLIG